MIKKGNVVTLIAVRGCRFCEKRDFILLSDSKIYNNEDYSRTESDTLPKAKCLACKKIVSIWLTKKNHIKINNRVVFTI